MISVILFAIKALMLTSATLAPLSPEESLKSFRLPAGLVIELVAAEPDVIEDLDRVTESVLIEQTRQLREQHQGRDGFIDDLNYMWIERFNSQNEAHAGQAGQEITEGKGGNFPTGDI